MTPEQIDQGGPEPPARALTPSERKVLAIWSRPEYYGSTDVECIEAAQVSKDTYYRIKRDPELRARRDELLQRMLEDGLRPAFAAMTATAMMEGREGFQDRRLLMEMAGEYTPKQTLNADLTHHKPAAEVPEPANYGQWLQARMAGAFGQTGGNGKHNDNRIPEEAPDAV